MPEHRYHQYCALARALDTVGDRWTLLIVRELLPGPRRFTDMVDGLPGISRKLLTERLRDLERDDVIARRELPPPAARQVYELTDDGRDLASAVAPLIVRELLPGPRRFTDMVDGLPGISRKLLTERLRDLERDDVIARRELPPPAARQVYELTDDGRDLASAVAPLIGWGAGRMGELEPEDTFHPRWAAVAMASLANREAAAGVRETYQFLVGDSPFHFILDDGSIELYDGRAEDPAVVLTTDEETLAKVASAKLTASSALASGALTITGDEKARKRFGEILGRSAIFAQARAVVTG